ncbi:MAG: glutamate 5-kinase [Lacipirellulaceae bacterium]
MDLVRQDIMTAADTIVVKVGTRVLTRAAGSVGAGTLDDERVAAIAEQLAKLHHAGKRVMLVSSGAVAAGMGRLGWTKRPSDLAKLQAAAAVGQSGLIEAYNRALIPHGLNAAQVLLTAEDLHERSRYLNVRNTLLALLEANTIPIINENDTVSVEELQLSFGDNDRLAALVTNLLRAPLLILLSDIDGLYDGNPSDDGTTVMSVVIDLAAAQEGLVHDGKDLGRQGRGLSTGGMTSKLQAARIVVSAGENVVIANGRRENVLTEILAGEDVGTLFLPEGRTVDSRRRWIGWSATPQGKAHLDAGAFRALAEQGRSLLAVGVTCVEGEFEKGDVISLCDANSVEFARGLTNYSAADLTRIAGQSTEQIAATLGHCPYRTVVHRDNLLVLS